MGGNFRVNTEDTNIHFDPHVAIDNQGDLGVTWSLTADPNYFKGLPFLSSVRYKIIAANGTVLVPETQSPTAPAIRPSPSTATTTSRFRGISFTANDNTGGAAAADVFADGVATLPARRQQQHRPRRQRKPDRPRHGDSPVFRVNSANFNTYREDDLAERPGQCADRHRLRRRHDRGATSGFGPDVSVNVSLAYEYFATDFERAAKRRHRRVFYQLLPCKCEFSNRDPAHKLGTASNPHDRHVVGYESDQYSLTYGGNGPWTG